MSWGNFEAQNQKEGGGIKGGYVHTCIHICDADSLLLTFIPKIFELLTCPALSDSYSTYSVLSIPLFHSLIIRPFYFLAILPFLFVSFSHIQQRSKYVLGGTDQHGGRRFVFSAGYL